MVSTLMNRERVLIIGSTGMLGQALSKTLSKHHVTHWGIARKNTELCIDITDKTALRNTISQLNPTIIINAAALTDLHYCEDKPLLAYDINARAAGHLANICQENAIYLIHISTDHFYLDTHLKHSELDPITLVNEYAKTKYLGECLASLNPASLIIRTNIVGFRHWGSNQLTFVESIIDKFSKNEHFNLFYDYYTSSIDVYSFSNILLDLSQIRASGIFNVGCNDIFSKKQFIIAFADKFNLVLKSMTDVSVNSFLSVKRATNLGLDVSKAETLLGYSFPKLDTVLSNLFSEYVLRETNSYV